MQVGENGVSADKGHYRQIAQKSFAPELPINGSIHTLGEISRRRYSKQHKQMPNGPAAEAGKTFLR